MNNQTMTPEQTLQAHPAPWRYVTLGGQVIMTDALGRQVPLFTILDFAAMLTQRLSSSRPAAPAAPAGESAPAAA